MDMTEQENTASKSGSEKRQRGKSLHIRLTDAEYAELVSRADAVEITPASYARMMLLDTPPPRGSRKPSVDRVAVARVLAELGKIGSNINQIAAAFNRRNDPHASEAVTALREVQGIRNACMEALNRKP